MLKSLTDMYFKAMIKGLKANNTIWRKVKTLLVITKIQEMQKIHNFEASREP